MEAAPQCGFTPVRRRISSSPSWRWHNTKAKAWTAARCHRLLRPLTSKVSILSKNQFRSSAETQTIPHQHSETTQELSVEDSRSPDDDSAADAEWARPRKRIKRTYSGRHGHRFSASQGESKKSLASKATNSSLPGEISVPTPIINRKTDQENYYLPVPQLQLDYVHSNLRQDTKRRHWAKGRDSRVKLVDSLQSIRRLTGDSRCGTYEGIYNSLETLLRDTSCSTSSAPGKKGARSLFSMCLKVVPHYIAEEEALASEEAAESGNKLALESSYVAAEIYDELESLGSSESGWAPLGIVTRAHGICIIVNAIQSGVLEENFSEALVTLCTHAEASDGAESIISGLLSNKSFPPPKTIYSLFSDDESTRSLVILSEYARLTGRTSYQYKHLTSLIANGRLPVSWVVTKEFTSLWTGAIKSLSNGLIDIDTFKFMENVLLLLASYRHSEDGSDASTTVEDDFLDVIKQTFLSLLATLSAIVILTVKPEHTAQHNNSAAYSGCPIDIVTLLRGCWAEYESSKEHPNNHSCLLLAANLVICLASQTEGKKNCFVERILSELRRHEKSSPNRSMSYGNLVLFISQVARCCGKCEIESGFECLESLHGWLEDSVSKDSGGESDILYELIIDSAFTFAQQMPHQKHLDYAENLNKRFHGKVATSWQSPLSNKSHSIRAGFRWEEGISEWIAATPAPMAEKIRCFEDWAQEDESENDSTQRSPIDLLRKGRKFNQVIDARKYTNRERQTSSEENNQKRDFSFPSYSELPYSTRIDELDSDCSSQLSESPGENNIIKNFRAPLIRSSFRSHKHKIKNHYDRAKRAPGRRTGALQGCITDWHILDEGSDDELSSDSVLYQKDIALSDIINSTHRPRLLSQNMRESLRGPKHLRHREDTIFEDSEDELCA